MRTWMTALLLCPLLACPKAPRATPFVVVTRDAKAVSAASEYSKVLGPVPFLSEFKARPGPAGWLAREGGGFLPAATAESLPLAGVVSTTVKAANAWCTKAPLAEAHLFRKPREGTPEFVALDEARTRLSCMQGELVLPAEGGRACATLEKTSEGAFLTPEGQGGSIFINGKNIHGTRTQLAHDDWVVLDRNNDLYFHQDARLGREGHEPLPAGWPAHQAFPAGTVLQVVRFSAWIPAGYAYVVEGGLPTCMVRDVDLSL